MTNPSTRNLPLSLVHFQHLIWIWIFLAQLCALSYCSVEASVATDQRPCAAPLSLTQKNHDYDLLDIIHATCLAEHDFDGFYKCPWVLLDIIPLSRESKHLTLNYSSHVCSPEEAPASKGNDNQLLSVVQHTRRVQLASLARDNSLSGCDWFWFIESEAQNPYIVQIEPEQDAIEADDNLDNEENSLAQVLASWLGLYDLGLSSDTVMGPLAPLDSSRHLLLDDFDSTDNLYRKVQSVPVDSLGGDNVFMPRKRVWSISKMEPRAGSHPTLPDPTSDPDSSLDDDDCDENEDEVDVGGGMYPLRVTRVLQQPIVSRTIMADIFARWDEMARDLGRQQSIGGLRSGNTVIDERNFALTR